MANLNVHVISHLKEEHAWAIDNGFRLYISYIVGYTTKKIINKDVLNLKQHCSYALLCVS